MANILQVTILRYPEIVGGVNTMVTSLVEQLRQRHRVCVLVPGDWGQETLARRKVGDVAVYSLRLRLPNDERHPVRGLLAWALEFPRTVWRLRSLVRAEGIELIHAHMALEHQMYLRALRWMGGPPYLITLHGSDVGEFPRLAGLRRLMVRLAVRGAGSVNAVSRWLAERAEQVFPCCAPVPWVYNGLVLPSPEVLGSALATRLLKPLPRRYAVMVGSFDPYKGHEQALRAWGRLQSYDRDLHLVVIGDGILRGAYESLIAEMGCDDVVHLIGEVPHDDVFRIMRGAELMVFPSRSEGLGYAILEAGALGVPVLCTRIPVFEEFITDGVHGILVPLDDAEAMVRAILLLTRDEGLRSRLGASLGVLVAQRFSAASMAAGYEALYASVLAAARRNTD